MHRLSFLLPLLFFSIFSAYSQPAQFFIGDKGDDQIAQMLRTADGHFLGTGTKSIGDKKQIWLLKFSPEGKLMWEKTFSSIEQSNSCYGIKVLELPNGGIFLLGMEADPIFSPLNLGLIIKLDQNGNEIWKKNYAQARVIYDATISGTDLLLVGSIGSFSVGVVMRINANGEMLWTQSIEIKNFTHPRRIFPAPDGNFLVVGRTNVVGAGFAGIFLQKIKPNGEQIWQKTYHTDWMEDISFPKGTFNDQPLGVVQMPNGHIWITSAYGYIDVGLFHFSAEGDLIEQIINDTNEISEIPYSLTLLPNGDWLIVGTSVTGAANLRTYQGFAICLNSKGAERWRRYYGNSSSKDQLFDGIVMDQSHFLFAGISNDKTGNGLSDGWLLRTETDGNIRPWTIEGRIVVDVNNNCMADAGEPPAKGWFLDVADTLSNTVVTDELGQFRIRRNDGICKVTALAPYPSASWTFCSNAQTVENNSNNPKTQLTFLVQATDGGCPHTEVSITQPDLRRCSTSTFIVTLQNRGAAASGELLLDLVLDPALSMVSASEAYIQKGNKVEFDIAPMGILQQKSITIQARLDCNVPLGATHGMVASVTPIECALLWNGPKYTVEGFCAGDELRFFLKNEGGGGANANSRYRVMADDLLYTDWQGVTLPENAAPLALSYPADGRTWRVELEQAPGFPSESHPAVTIEGCGKGRNGLHSIGLRNAWRYDDGTPELAAVLAPNTTGVPDKVAEGLSGFGHYRFVDNRQWLEYTARVHNPLPGTAESVEFRFIFTPNLNIQTFQVLASNEPVQLKIDENKQLRAIMPNVRVKSGEFVMLRFRILPYPATPADSSRSSLFRVVAVAHFDDGIAYPLINGINNYSKSYPSSSDIFNDYPPEILRFGGKHIDFGSAIAQSSDGAVFLGGASNSYSDRSNFDGLIVKTNAKGQALWLNAIEFGDLGENYIRAVVAMKDGGCMLSGNYLPFMAEDDLSNYSAFITRLDANGQMLWHKLIRPVAVQYGAASNGLLPTKDGHFLTFGQTLSANYNVDHYYLKFDENGGVIWQQYSLVDSIALNPVSGIATDDGGFIFMGVNAPQSWDFNVYIEKIDANGVKIWNKQYQNEKDVFLESMTQSPDGHYLVCGHTSSWQVVPGKYYTTPALIFFAPDGTKLWEKYPVIDQLKEVRLSHIITAAEGGYFCVGYTSVGDYDAFLLKLDKAGEVEWWRNYGLKNHEGAFRVLSPVPNQLWLWGTNGLWPPYYDEQALLFRTDLRGNLLVVPEQPPAAPEAKVSVYPNPSRDIVHVNIQFVQSIQSLKWQLSDPRGLVVRRGEAGSGDFDLSVQGLPAGIYYLSFGRMGMPVKKIVVMD